MAATGAVAMPQSRVASGRIDDAIFGLLIFHSVFSQMKIRVRCVVNRLN